MLDFDVLVERTLRSIRPLAGFDWASVVPLDFVRRSSKPFFAVVFAALALLDLLALFFKLAEARS